MTTATAIHTFSVERWQELADFVLPVLVAEQMNDNTTTHYWKAQTAGLLSSDFPPGIWRETYKVVTELVIAERPVHLATVRDSLNGHGSDPHLAQWFTMYRSEPGKPSTLTGPVFHENIRRLREYGERARLINDMTKTLRDLQAGHPLEDVAQWTLSSLATSGIDTIERETAKDMAADFKAWLSEPPAPTMLTGLSVIDRWLNGGIARGSFGAIVAPFKQRKTSLALNMLLNMARQGRSVAIMMFESDKRRVAAQFVSMLAIEYIRNQKLYNRNIVDDKDKMPVERVWGDELYRIKRNYQQWGDVRKAAVDYAIAEFGRISRYIRVYDRTHKGGGLRDLNSIYRVLLYDKRKYKSDLIVIDHAQRIVFPGNDYERLSAMSGFIESICRREEIAVCLLAQKKLDRVEGDDGQHASGTRGGTALDEAVDYMLTVGYKQKIPGAGDEGIDRYPPHKLIVGMHLNRYGNAGPDQRSLIDIDPNSGLILNGGKGMPLSSFSSEGKASE